MILPQSQLAILLIAILGTICLGLWSSFFKFGDKWRFELFYIAFAIGVFMAVLLYGFTFGNLGFDGFSLMDDISRAGKRQWVFGIMAGVIFNLGNMFLVAAVSVSGMSVAFPISASLGILGGFIYRAVMRGPGRLSLLVAGGLAMIITVVAGMAANSSIFAMRRKDAQAADGRQRRKRAPMTAKGPLLAIAGGILMGVSIIPLTFARYPEIGLGPYSLGVFFSLGMLLSTGLFALFFMNLPVEGEPLEVLDILKVHPLLHLLGIAGGGVFATGMMAAFIVQDLPPEQAAPLAVFLGMGPAAAFIAALIGLAVWKDFRDSDARGKTLAVSTAFLLAIGAALLGFSINVR